eukprot:4666235-Amphidinium_carterae.2
MKDTQVQPWWQYEDDITMFSELAEEAAMNKELSQLLNKQSFQEVDSRTLAPQQLQHVVPTRWVITQRPTNNGTKDIKCRLCGKGFSQFISDTNTQTLAATPSSTTMRLLLTIAILKQFTVFTYCLHNRHGQCFPQYANCTRSACTTTNGVLPRSSMHNVINEKRP